VVGAALTRPPRGRPVLGISATAFLLGSVAGEPAASSPPEPVTRPGTPEWARAAEGLREVVVASKAEGPLPFKLECVAEQPACGDEKYTRLLFSKMKPEEITNVNRPADKGSSYAYVDELKVQDSAGYWVLRLFWTGPRRSEGRSLKLSVVRADYCYQAIP
jgi:hypothetical protein